MGKTYVIGLSPIRLLRIIWEFNVYEGKTEISRIMHGIISVYDATLFGDLDDAKNALKEIQDRYQQIVMITDNIVDSLVYGNDFDPMQLHIYEVRVGWEVK